MSSEPIAIRKHRSEATVEHPAPMHDQRALLTVDEVAELLRVPSSWVYERTRSRTANRIPGFRLGKYWRFREIDLFAWLERQKDGISSHA